MVGVFCDWKLAFSQFCHETYAVSWKILIWVFVSFYFSFFPYLYSFLPLYASLFVFQVLVVCLCTISFVCYLVIAIRILGVFWFPLFLLLILVLELPLLVGFWSWFKKREAKDVRFRHEFDHNCHWFWNECHFSCVCLYKNNLQEDSRGPVETNVSD